MHLWENKGRKEEKLELSVHTIFITFIAFLLL